jgi:hypothetical protein
MAVNHYDIANFVFVSLRFLFGWYPFYRISVSFFLTIVENFKT